MRVPWGAPTLSDSDKLEFTECSGETIAILSPQTVETQDFSSGTLPSGWTELDTGGKVVFQNGRMEIAGSGSYDANGVYTSERAATPSVFSVEFLIQHGDPNLTIGVIDSAALDYNNNYFKLFVTGSAARGMWGGSSWSTAGLALALSTTYTVRTYIGLFSAGHIRVTIQGGAYTDETVLFDCYDANLPSTLRFQIAAQANVDPSYIDNVEWKIGFDTGGEYMEFTADAGTGQVFGGLDWTNAAAPTGISTTNLKYQYSYDNGTPSYNGSWLTLAQLQAVGAVAGNYRYIRLRVQLNSDGATQNYGAEVNASDLIDGVFAQLSPDAPSWNGLPTAGDGQVTLPVTTVNPTDVVYARYKRFQALGGWSAESETLKRTGSGNIVVTGLTNEVGYEFTIYTKSGVLTSDWIGPRYRTPTDGSASFIERVMNAVVDDLNTATIADPSGTTLVAAKEIPPDFNDVATGCFKVFPDTELAAAARNRNDITPRVTIAYCQRSKTAAQRTTQMYIREQVRDLFLGRRLTSLPEAICVAETESGVVDLDNLWQHFQWISPITLEFSAMRRRG